MPPDRWFELTVMSDEDPTLVSSALVDLGADSVQESGDTLVTYFLPPPTRKTSSSLSGEAWRVFHLPSPSN